MAKRYGQRPSSLLPKATLEHEEQALAFDFNVMLAGMAVELRAQDEARRPRRGVISNRRDALALARRARAVADAEFSEAS